MRVNAFRILPERDPTPSCLVFLLMSSLAELPPFTIHTFKDSPFLKQTFVEHVDSTRLRQLINVGYDEEYTSLYKSQTGVPFDNVRSHLLNIVDNVQDEKLYVLYKRPKRTKHDQGRVFANYSRSLFCLPKDVRGYLMKDLSTDHDIQCCHATLLYDDAQRGDVACPALEQYVKDPDTTLDKIIDVYKVSRDVAKKLPLVLLYGGSQERWSKEFKVKMPKGGSPIADGFCQDLEAIGSRVRSANKKTWDNLRARIHKENVQRKKDGKPQRNARACLMALYAQNLERRVLEHVYANLNEESREHFVYCFDGFMSKRQIDTAQLEEWSHELFPSCKWSHKPFGGDKLREHVEQHPDKNVDCDVDDVEITDDAKRCFNLALFKSFKSYQKKKQYFEYFCAKVRCGEYWFTQEQSQFENGVWVKELKHRKLTSRDLMEAYGDIKVGLVPHKDGKRDGVGKVITGVARSSKDFPSPLKFIQRWTEDEDKRSYNTLDFCPQPVPYEEVTHTHDVLNTFLGYPRFLFDGSIKPQKRDRELLVLWRDILKNLVGGGGLTCAEQDETLHAVECFFAHSIFNPSTRLQHGLIMQSQEGEGKGSVAETLCNLVGTEHYFSSSNITDLFGSHSEEMENRLFLNLDEVDFSQTKDKAGRLKALVTAPRWTINPKNIRPYTVNVFASVIITTNNKFSIALDISKGERRWWVLCGTGKYAGKKMPREKWAMLHSAKGWKSKTFLHLLFQHLQKVYNDNLHYDFNTFKFLNSRRTPYRELALNVVPDVAFYLQTFLETNRYVYAGVPYVDGKADVAKIKGRHYEHIVPKNTEGEVRFDQMEQFNQTMLYCGSSLVRDFRQWGESNCYSYSSSRNEKSFYRMLQDLCLPVTKVMKNNAVFLEMNMKQVYQTLYTKNYIDIDPKTTWVQQGVDTSKGDPSEHVCDWSALR